MTPKELAAIRDKDRSWVDNDEVTALLDEVERLNSTLDAVSSLWAKAVTARKDVDARTLARILDGGDGA